MPAAIHCLRVRSAPMKRASAAQRIAAPAATAVPARDPVRKMQLLWSARPRPSATRSQRCEAEANAASVSGSVSRR